jgi:hypothetical protein
MRSGAREAWWAITVTAAIVAGVVGAITFALAHFAIGCALLALGVLLLRWPRSIWIENVASACPPTRRWLLFALVVAVAVFFRFYRMSPPGLWGDDALNGLLAFSVLDGRIGSPFEIVTHSHSRFHALSNYAIAASFELFGAGPTTLRLPGIVANTLCVPLLYAAFAPLFGARAALLAALFFATSAWQLSHAKGLTQIVLGASFQIAGLCLLVRGMTGRRRWLVVAAAVPLALCVYTYHSAKIAPLVALPYFIAAALETPRPRRRTWLLGALALATLALCLVPAYLSYANDPGALITRVAGTSLLPAIREQGWPPLWKSLQRTLLIFHYQQGPLQYHWFGLGFDPALDCVVGFLALHGLFETLRHPLRSRNVLLLSWLAVGLVPAVFSTEAPRAYRAFLASPPAYVFAALPVARLFEVHPSSRRIRLYLRTVAMLLVLSVPVIDFNYYFYRLYTHPTFQLLQAEPLVAMATELRRRGREWTGFVLADTFDTRHETLRFLNEAWGLRMRSIASLSEVLPMQEAVGSALFLMSRGTMAAQGPLMDWYRGAESEVLLEPQPRDWFLDVPLPFSEPPRGRAPTVAFVAVPDVETMQPRGAVAAFLSAEGAVIGSENVSRLEIPARPPRLAHGIRFSAVLAAPRFGTYRFQSPAKTALWLDGIPVIDAGSTSGSIELSRGPHLLISEASLDGAELLWQPPDENAGPIPDRQLFSLTHGLTVERRRRGRSERRHDPYPFYVTLLGLDDPDESIHWTGRLSIPAPYACRLRIDASGPVAFTIDGESVQSPAKVRPGIHQIEISLLHPLPPTRFALFRQQRTKKWEEIPWDLLEPQDKVGP